MYGFPDSPDLLRAYQEMRAWARGKSVEEIKAKKRQIYKSGYRVDDYTVGEYERRQINALKNALREMGVEVRRFN